jgi:hypothetical protein
VSHPDAALFTRRCVCCGTEPAEVCCDAATWDDGTHNYPVCVSCCDHTDTMLQAERYHRAEGLPVVLSYGMGVESTAILLRWLAEPATAPCALHDLTVLTAMVGSEFHETGRLVHNHVLPRLRAAGVRFVQVGRGGPFRADGVVTLDDSREPETLHLGGAYTLREEYETSGTGPQYTARRCSIKAKGEPLDRWLIEAGFTHYRHALGFCVGEERRADRDRGFRDVRLPKVGRAKREPFYPLLDWGWDRQACEDYIEALTGVTWPKSCCSFCPFAGTKRNLQTHLARLITNPAEAIEALLVEYQARCFNERQQLYARFHKHLASEQWAVYRVRRLPGLRSVAREYDCDVTQEEAQAAILAHGGALTAGGIHRSPQSAPEGGEHFLVAAPAVTGNKARKGFDKAWAKARLTIAS